MVTLFVISLLLSAYFSGSETAFVSSNRLRFQIQNHESIKRRPVLFLLSNAQRFLTTTLVGNNIVMVTCSTLAVVLFTPYLSESVIVVLTTISLLLFGEILPKSIAQQLPNRLIRISAPLMLIFYFVFYPLNKIAELMSQWAINIFRGNKGTVNTFFRKQDLLVLLREYFSTKTLSMHDRQLIAKAMKIGDIRVVDIMIPRTDIVGIEHDTPVEEITDLFIKTGYSRFPVFGADMDNVLGFLYFQDLLGLKKNKKPIIHEALVIPESAKAIHALNTLRTKGKSIALVVDEHGGTAGLLTLENIVEQVFGSIYDEFDTSQDRIRAFNESTIVASGRTEVEDLIERHKLPVPEGDYVTIAGFIIDYLGYIPKPGEKIKFPWATITILNSDDTKISDIKIVKHLYQKRIKNE